MLFKKIIAVYTENNKNSLIKMHSYLLLKKLVTIWQSRVKIYEFGPCVQQNTLHRH
jgi:hypothetical protein